MRIDLAPNSYTELEAVPKPGSKAYWALENLKKLAAKVEVLLPVEPGGHVEWTFFDLSYESDSGVKVENVMAMVFWRRANGTGFLAVETSVIKPINGEAFDECAGEIVRTIVAQKDSPLLVTSVDL